MVHIDLVPCDELDQRQGVAPRVAHEPRQVFMGERQEWVFAAVAATRAAELEELGDGHLREPHNNGISECQGAPAGWPKYPHGVLPPRNSVSACQPALRAKSGGGGWQGALRDGTAPPRAIR